MTLFWIKIILAAGLLGGIALHFKIDRDRTQELRAAKERIIVLEADVAAKTKKVSDLNDRNKERNAETLAEVEKAKADELAALAQADAARADRAKLAGDLATARRKYQEAVNTDENLRTYRAVIVPVPVLERLRVANGETGN